MKRRSAKPLARVVWASGEAELIGLSWVLGMAVVGGGAAVHQRIVEIGEPAARPSRHPEGADDLRARVQLIVCHSEAKRQGSMCQVGSSGLFCVVEHAAKHGGPWL